MELTKLDRTLLGELAHIPFDDQIFEKLAEKLSISSSTVIERLSRLKERGFVRRWGVHINTRTLGYQSALVALVAETSQIELIREWVNAEDGVSHCYTRALKELNGTPSEKPLSKFNVWLTLTSVNQKSFTKKIENLKSFCGLEESELLLLPAQQKFKLRFDFVPQ